MTSYRERTKCTQRGQAKVATTHDERNLRRGLLSLCKPNFQKDSLTLKHEKHDREARKKSKAKNYPIEKEGKMRICRDEISLEYYNASTREDHTGSGANSWLSETDRQSHT